MPRSIVIPEDPLSRFVEIYECLNQDRGWLGDPVSLRFAASAAITCPGEPDDVASQIRRVADEISEASGWFGELKSSLRFIVSALLVQEHDDAAEFLVEVERVRTMFRDRSLRRGGIYETMAILILRMRRDGAPVSRADVSRFQDIYEEMKRHHWWLTGPDDFPACAILVSEPETAATIGQRIEDIYQSLDREGMSTGDPLQTAANLLFLAREPAARIAKRYAKLASEFRAAGVSIWQSDYDELAILSFLDVPADRLVELVLAYRAEMERLNPKPDRSMTFNLASGVAFLAVAREVETASSVSNAKAMMNMQAIIQAQQAAAAAAASSAAAASAASSGGS